MVQVIKSPQEPIKVGEYFKNNENVTGGFYSAHTPLNVILVDFNNIRTDYYVLGRPISTA